MRSRIFLILSVAILFAFATPTQTVPAETDPAQQISSVMDEWAKDWQARNPGAIAALYAPDAAIYRATDGVVGETLAQHEAIPNFFQRFFAGLADPKRGDAVSHSAPQVVGDLAFDDGVLVYVANGKCTPRAVGEGPCVIKGYYLTVLRRGPDNKWLIVRQALSQIGEGSTIYSLK
jgi:ketosteroid isomerase-like protein